MRKILSWLIVLIGFVSHVFADTADEYRSACNNADMKGCYHLGLAYSNGEGVKKNIESAKSFLQIACDGGVADACAALQEPTTTRSMVPNTRKQPQPAHTSVQHVKPFKGYVDGKLQADIDRDGKKETIAWKKFATVELGDYYQLLVLDDDGSLLWEGPKEKDEANPYVFSSLHIGVSLPELLTDIDNDGYIELLTPELQSDVSPAYYKKLRWRDGQFEVLWTSVLMMPSGSNRFKWKRTDGDYGTWVSELAPYSKGMAKATVTLYHQDGSTAMGVALIRFDRDGAAVERWLEPLTSTGGNEGDPSGEALSSTVPPPQANHTYRARLSNRDHQNSGGKRLVKVKDVLRQDRANLYKQGGDSEDQRDPYFHTGKGRNTMEWIEMHPVGSSYASMKEIIVNGTPLVEVDVRKDGLYIKIIKRSR